MQDGRSVIFLLRAKKYLLKIQRRLEIFLYSLLSYISFIVLIFEMLSVIALLKIQKICMTAHLGFNRQIGFIRVEMCLLFIGCLCS